MHEWRYDMAYQTVFKRYELKYIITREQKARILDAMQPYMIPDIYGRSTIRNIYFDTDDYILARHSIAKPDFKEKLRIRSYSAATSESTVFVELKRKADHLVYKRRVALPECTAMSWTQGLRAGGYPNSQMSTLIPPQMGREIDYFLSYYGHLRPTVFLSYDRQAFRMRDDAIAGHTGQTAQHDMDFRVTFDENILFRDYDLSLKSEVYGTPLLEEGKVLMELKCSGGLPMWMVEVLSAEHVYKTSFSKYGTAYTNYIHPMQQSMHAAAVRAGNAAGADSALPAADTRESRSHRPAMADSQGSGGRARSNQKESSGPSWSRKLLHIS